MSSMTIDLRSGSTSSVVCGEALGGVDAFAELVAIKDRDNSPRAAAGARLCCSALGADSNSLSPSAGVFAISASNENFKLEPEHYPKSQ